MDDSTSRESLAITVYNNNLGVIRDVRKFNIANGVSDAKMTDVPSLIDPTSVKITALDHPKDFEVTEQNYEYDLVNQDKLLEKYIDKPITIITASGERQSVKLLSNERGAVTLMTPLGIKMMSSLNGYTIDVPTLPTGLITRPTLIWQLSTDKKLDNEPLEVLYQTGGLTWHAEYIASLGDDDKSLDLSGWVSIDNTSGATFPNAKLKLVAGDIHRAYQPAPKGMADYETRSAVSSFGKPQFEERGMFEYHLYDLQRKTTIKNAETKQVSLLNANGVTSTKHYTYEGGTKVAVTIEFVNSEDNHLGIPIPMGTVRVMKRDKDGSMEFVGEDHVDHTPRDEKITLHVGDAFDLVGERVVTDSRNLGDHANQETIQITLKNHKDENVTIDALEEVGGNWEITKSSMDYEKKNANEIIFHVPVKARGEQKVTYTIMHHW
jgi:hypothetical protein